MECLWIAIFECSFSHEQLYVLSINFICYYESNPDSLIMIQIQNSTERTPFRGTAHIAKLRCEDKSCMHAARNKHRFQYVLYRM